MIPSETQFADALVKLFGEDKARTILGEKTLNMATDAWVNETLRKEGLFSGMSGTHLFGRVRNALAGQRSILSREPEYATAKAKADDITLYFKTLFGTKEVLSKEGLTQHKRVAEVFLLPFKEVIEENNPNLYTSMVKDLTVFLSVVAETMNISFTALNSESDTQQRTAALSIGKKSRADYTRLTVHENRFAQLEAAYRQGMSDTVLAMWMSIKEDIFHESIHFIQILDSDLMLFLSTFILRALSPLMQEQQETEDMFGPRVREHFYMMLIHETEAYTASAFVEQLGSRMKEQCGAAVTSVVKCFEKLENNQARLASKDVLSIEQKVTIIESSIDVLEELRDAVLHLERPVTGVTFGSSLESEYIPSPLDILGIADSSEGMHAVTLQYARSGFRHYVTTLQDKITSIEPQLSSSPTLRVLVGTLHERLNSIA